MHSKTWNCLVDDWATWAVCWKDDGDPISWFDNESDAKEELAEFSEEDQLELAVMPIHP